MTFATSDLFDEHADTARTLGSPLADFGGLRQFSGKAVTVRCFEDNSIVKELAGQPGAGRVLVVDGGGSLRCALMGDMIARNAQENGWEGAIIFGAVRDRVELTTIRLGIKALGSTPRKSVRLGAGERDVVVVINGVAIKPDDIVYADEDGVIILG